VLERWRLSFAFKVMFQTRVGVSDKWELQMLERRFCLGFAGVRAFFMLSEHALRGGEVCRGTASTFHVITLFT
jgi:hypothetical protein